MSLKKEIFSNLKALAIAILIALLINYTLAATLKVQKPVMVVVSSSMEPTIKPGDIIVVKKVNIEDIKVGDIIVYKNPYTQKEIVHRVIYKGKKYGKVYLITKGDNDKTNPLPDQLVGAAPPITEEIFVGKVILIIPYLGYPRYLVYLIFKI